MDFYPGLIAIFRVSFDKRCFIDHTTSYVLIDRLTFFSFDSIIALVCKFHQILVIA